VVVLCHSQQQASHVKSRLAEWLGARGVAFNEDKTKIVHLGEVFDFGFDIRRYPNRKLLVKPSEAALRRVRERVSGDATAAPTWSGSPGRTSNRGIPHKRVHEGPRRATRRGYPARTSVLAT
jgi:hypothetical protein